MIAFCKTITYGIMHVTVATLLAYLISGDWHVAISIGLLEPFVQTFFFYFHEKIWERIKLRLDRRRAEASAF